VTEAAEAELDLDPELAARYLDRLKSPTDGLVADSEVDLDALTTVVRLRERYLSSPGVDVLAPASGLLARRTDARATR
jgi:hypothetical protein